MNPFSVEKPFRKGRNHVSNANKVLGRQNRRSTKQLRLKYVKLRESYGLVETKDKLKCAMLNVNGLDLPSLSYVRSTLTENPVDLCILLETKRRNPEPGYSIDVDGYNVEEVNRSDTAGDKGGGGIAIYTKKGMIFTEHHPKIENPDHIFVRNERVWRLVHSSNSKTAICGVYAGFQASDDRNSLWNDILFSVLKSEIVNLRNNGYRVILLGDMNSHVGCAPNVGIAGNHAPINRNGTRFLKFLEESHCIHVNGQQHLTQGLWTRQQGGVSTVLDYAVVSSEHIGSVNSMVIDDRGKYGTGSDHNWIFLTVNDVFRKKLKVSNSCSKKQSWNMRFDQDWSSFRSKVDELVSKIDLNAQYTTETLAFEVANVLQEAGIQDIGFKSSFSSKSHKSSRLPWPLVSELKLKHSLERDWKIKSSEFNSLPSFQKTEDLKKELLLTEQAYLDQKHKVSDLLYQSWEGRRIVLCSLSTYMIDVSKRFMIDVVIEFLRAYDIYE